MIGKYVLRFYTETAINRLQAIMHKLTPDDMCYFHYNEAHKFTKKA